MVRDTVYERKASQCYLSIVIIFFLIHVLYFVLHFNDKKHYLILMLPFLFYFLRRNEKAKANKANDNESEYGAQPYIGNSLSGTVRSMKSLTSVSPSAYSSEDGMEDVVF